MSKLTGNLGLFSFSIVFWVFIFVLHCAIHVRSVLSVPQYGYEKDLSFIIFGFVFSWGAYYIAATLLTLLAVALLQLFLKDH